MPTIKYEDGSILRMLIWYEPLRYLLYELPPNFWDARWLKVVNFLKEHITDAPIDIAVALYDEYPEFRETEHLPLTISMAEKIVTEWKKHKIQNYVIKSLKQLTRTQMELDDLLLELQKLSSLEIGQQKFYATMEEDVSELETYIKRIRNKENFVELPYLSKILNPAFGGELILIAARTSMGKTAFMLNMAWELACSGVPVAFASLEMSKEEILLRLAQRWWDIRLMQAIKNFDDKQLNTLFEQFGIISQKPLYRIETPRARLSEIYNGVKAVKMQKDIQVLFVDYIQIVRTSHKGTRNEEIGFISKTLKRIAMEFGITVIAGAQLNRATEHNEDAKPTLANLRDSGDLEQDADVVTFLWRPGYYGKGDKEKLVVMVAKNRNGALGNINLRFDLTHQIIKEV